VKNSVNPIRIFLATTFATSLVTVASVLYQKNHYENSSRLVVSSTLVAMLLNYMFQLCSLQLQRLRVLESDKEIREKGEKEKKDISLSKNIKSQLKAVKQSERVQQRLSLIKFKGKEGKEVKEFSNDILKENIA
jgi:hypothetical protein